MSSESDEDFSYTNSVSVLKNLTKKDASVSDENDGVTNGDLALLETPKPMKTRSARCNSKKGKPSESILIADDSPVRVDNKDECVVLSDEEQNISLNIISTIDTYLQKSTKSKKKPKKGKRGKNATAVPRVTRNSQKTALLPDVEVRAPVIRTTNICCNIEDSEDDTIEDVNYDVSVKVWWKFQYVEKFTMRRFEKLNVIFEHFADKENVPKDRLLFTIGDRFVSPTDTPDTLNVNAVTIIEGGVLSEKANYIQSSNQDDVVELKVQMKDRKHPMLISIKSTDCMNVLMCKCAEELNVLISDLKFYFDGDLIKKNDTPGNLQLEGGECIDCLTK